MKAKKSEFRRSEKIFMSDFIVQIFFVSNLPRINLDSYISLVNSILNPKFPDGLQLCFRAWAQTFRKHYKFKKKKIVKMFKD